MTLLIRTIVLATLTALITGSTPTRAQISPRRQAFFNQHVDLLRAVQETGVSTYINPRICFENKGPKYNGMYRPMGHGTMVICQQGATPQDEGKEVGWTDEDLDTLRHESHHLVQDCMGGVKGDLQLVPVFATRDGLESFIFGVLSQEEVDWIKMAYGRAGATPEVIWLEIETFAVARAVDAGTIAQAVRQQCKIN